MALASCLECESLIRQCGARGRGCGFLEVAPGTQLAGQGSAQSTSTIAGLVTDCRVHHAPVVPHDRVIDGPMMLIYVARLDHMPDESTEAAHRSRIGSCREKSRHRSGSGKCICGLTRGAPALPDGRPRDILTEPPRHRGAVALPCGSSSRVASRALCHNAPGRVCSSVPSRSDARYSSPSKRALTCAGRSS